MIPALLLAASAISLPHFNQAGLQEYVFKTFDFYKLSPKDRSLGVTANLWIEPHGRIIGCWIGRSVGNEEAVKGLCRIMLGMYANPGRDAQGHRAYGFVAMTFLIPDGSTEQEARQFAEAFFIKPNSTDPEGILPFADPRLSAQSHYRLNLLVSTDGSVADCSMDPNMPDELADKACALARAKDFAVRRASGKAVPYVRSVALVPNGLK